MLIFITELETSNTFIQEAENALALIEHDKLRPMHIVQLMQLHSLTEPILATI